MKVRIRALGALTATLAAVPFAVALGSTAADAAVNPPAATVVTSLGAVGGTSAWNIGGDQTGSPTDAISPTTDPTYVDGSLHQATPANADKAQVVHSLLSDASDPTSGATLASISSLAYSTMDSTTATNPALPALQLSMTGCPTTTDPSVGFTTFVFEPVYNTDQGTPAAGQWHSWDAINGGNAKWWSTQSVTGLTATQASPATWSQIVAACPAGKAYQLPVNLGSGAAGSDAYVDRVSYNGTTWDFAVTGAADFTTTTPRLVTVGAPPVQFSGTVTNPSTGPDYQNVRYDFTLSGISGLKANQVTLQWLNGATWTDIPLTDGTGSAAGTITGYFGPSTGFPLPPGTDATHPTTKTTQFRVAIAAGAPTGTLTVDNQLNAVDATSGAVVKTIAEHSSTLGVADEYQPVTPTRLVDTRVSGNVLNNGPLGAGSNYTLDLGATGAQLDAAAYVFNVTAVHPAGAGNLRIGPACGAGTPGTSIVNFQPGKDVANDLVISNLVNGTPCNQFNVYADGHATNVIIDLQGFYSASTGFASSQSPTRAVDTRIGQGGTSDPIAGGTSAAFTIGGSFGVPADAKAVAINVTAVGPAGNGNMRVYPDGADLPTTSNINYVKGVDKAAFDIVKLGADGKIDVYSDGSAANVVIDVFGYIPAGSQTVTQTPVRVLDTRQAGGGGPIVDGSPINVPITANANSGVPAGATAVIVSLTAVRVPGGAGVGNLRAWGSGDMPTVSNINYIGPNTDVANMAIVPLAADGSIMLATQGSSMNALVDVLGYVPASTPPTS